MTPPLRLLLATLTLALCPPALRATIPEPDTILYGNITLDETLVTAARTDVVIEARRTINGPAISSYRMGANPALGNFYALRLRLESVAPISHSDASQVGDGVFIVVTDATGPRAQANYTLTSRGVAERVDFGAAAADSDGDGLPDAWELLHFGNLNQTPDSLAANGMTVLDNFIAGTAPNDPDSAFRLAIDRTHQQQRVTLVALRAEGPGYEGMTRRYTLESRAALSEANWAGVPGFVDMVGNNQTVAYLTTGAGATDFFRGRIALQGFAMPGNDSDGDGLPDAWELAHFGNLDQSGTSITANGQTALFNYLTGTDPNDVRSVFSLSATIEGGNRVISFLAHRAQGAGYEGRTRYYALESSTDLRSWSPVPNFGEVSGEDQIVVFTPPPAASAPFFRARVWLAP